MKRLVAVAAVLLVAAACGGRQGGTGPTTTKAPGTSTTLPQGVNTQLVQDLLQRLAQGRLATFKADYDFSAPASVSPIPSGKLSLAQAPPRSAATLTGDKQAVAFVTSGTGTVACAAAASPTAWQCTPTDAAATAPPLSVPSLTAIVDQLRPAQYYFAFHSSQDTIAGQRAYCVKADATDKITPDVKNRVGTTARICVSAEGVPLWLETQGSQAPISLQATSYTKNVPDAAFVPPATPVVQAPPQS